MNAEFPRPANRKHLIYTILISILAAIPSIWVFKTRWLDPFPGFRLFRWWYGWCSWQLFCQTTLPGLAIVGFPVCAVSLAVLFLLIKKSQIVPSIITSPDSHDVSAVDAARKQQVLLPRILLGISCVGFFLILVDSLSSGRIPGWDLVAVFLCFLAACFFSESRDFPGWIRKNAGFSLSIFLNHLLFIAVMYAGSEQKQWMIMAVAAFLISLVNLLRYRNRLPPIYFVFLLAILLFTLWNNTWWSSLVGDEYSQFELDYALVQKQDLAWFGNNLFNPKGNFGTTPMLATYIQVFFMKVLGVNGFGWRFSNAYLCAFGIVLFYYFLRKFVVERIAWTSAALLASSEYLISFGKIGYTNLQAFFAFALVLAVAAWASQSKSKWIFCLLGSSLAFCCYIFPAALYVLPLPILFLCFYYPPNTREAVKHWGIMLAALGLLIYPLFLQPIYWIEKVPGTILVNPNAMESAGTVLNHILSNVFYAFFSFLYVQRETHFIAASYADPLTGMFILIGFFFLLFQTRKHRFLVFWMAGFLILLLAVGASHGYDFPPTTRMFLILPWWMLFAAAGLEYLLAQCSALVRFPRKAWLGVHLGIVLLVIGLNEYQAQRLAYTLYGSRPPLEAIFIRQAEEVKRINPGNSPNYIFLTDTSWTTEGFKRFPMLYPQILGGASISTVKIVGPDIPASVYSSIAAPDTIIFILPFFHLAWQRNIEDGLIKTGKKPCRIRAPEGVEIVVVYSVPEYTSTCHDRWGFSPE